MSEPGPDDFDDGWDMTASLVDGRWVDRSPRRPEVEPQARREAALLPWLAPQLPLPVPVPRITSEAPLVLRHACLPGAPCPGTSAAHGRAIGAFLRRLHAVDVDDAVRHGVQDAVSAYAADQAIRDRMAVEVLPRLPAALRRPGEALLERTSRRPTAPCVVHGDLGLHHIRVTGDDVTGVIDWGDCRVGDPAIDLCATTIGADAVFAQGVLESYDAAPDLMERARDWHLLGPWHEVLFGIDTDQTAYVESGLAGAVSRLER